MQSDQRWRHLLSLLSDMRLAVVAFSGGVDSSLLLRAAAETLGQNLIAVTAASETYPSGELEHAKSFARSLGIRHRIIESKELEQEAFTRNGPDRCYHCKRELFSRLRMLAESEGIAEVLDGANHDDNLDYRPGRRAALEFSVRSPLAEAGMTKEDIRTLAKSLGLAAWDKPSLACLSSRIPYGTQITPALLLKIQQAEDIVRGAGVRIVRVRHHGDIARIEIEPSSFYSFLRDEELRESIVRKIKALGYTYVCLDMGGYRSGSMNEQLSAEVKEREMASRGERI
ncbi:MAG: ATP-dependent sacrificial sulfur transferase LarE [Nitrospiraceae bacterium]|nr:ATP-dependent sacrificial sulfur transferase LarE [Nitrospiraceae bacterium]